MEHDSAALDEHYETLGLPFGASLDEIKSAYKKLVLRYHPDKNDGDPAAAAVFIRIQEAYEALKESIAENEQESQRERERETRKQHKRERDAARKREKRRQEREEREREREEREREEQEMRDYFDRQRENKRRKREQRDEMELEHPVLLQRIAELENERAVLQQRNVYLEHTLQKIRDLIGCMNSI